MVKLPEHYYHPRCYWAHMVTLRCSARCEYCILDGRGNHIKRKEISGQRILDWWNGVEHPTGQKLSIIGGEPTLHKDIIAIVNGLKNYNITITTNCKSPFYNDPNFHEKFQVHPTSTLRINTSFHPKHITGDEYLAIIEQWRTSPYFVDRTSFVYTPDVMEKYGDEIAKVEKGIALKSGPFLGFYNDEDGFDAPFEERNLMPNESFHDQNVVKEVCGISDLDAFRHITGRATGMETECWHPRRSLIIGPDGKYYHCHYKMYYDIGHVCDIEDFQPLPDKAVTCRHYGLCNWCDVPRAECVAKKAVPQILTKLYDAKERELPEVDQLFSDIQKFGEDNSLECSPSKWFEYAYSLLYSGHRFRGKVLNVGSVRSAFIYYLGSRGYDVTTIDIADEPQGDDIGRKFGVKSIFGDLGEFNPDLEGKFDLITNLNTIEQIDEDTKAVQNLARYLRPGGIMVISTNFYDQYIGYLSVDGKVCYRVYTPEMFTKRILEPLEKMGVQRVGSTDFANVDISTVTSGISIVRKLT